MYAVSDAYMAAAGANARQILVKAVFNGSITMTGENIIDMTVTEALNASDGISMGATASSKLSLRFKMPDTPILLTGGWIEPYVGYYGVEDYCPLGKFYITDISSKDTIYTITAYDGFSKTEIKYTPHIEMPNTSKAILNDIAGQCGFEILEYGASIDLDGVLLASEMPSLDNDGVLTYPEDPTLTGSGNLILDSGVVYPEGVFDLYDFTCRQYIGYFAGLCGKNARFNRDGKLVFLWYTNTDASITQDLQYMGGFSKKMESQYTVQSITSGTNDNLYTSGTGVGISFENPFITQEILDGIAAEIGTPSFTPATIKWRGNPAVESGDIVVADDKYGVSHNIYIMEQTLKISGGLYSEIKCYGATEESIAFDTSPQTKRLKQVYSDLQAAIAEATKLLNGAGGGVFEIIDENGDKINDGWIIHSADGQKFIKATLNGIGITNDGGATYEEAITPNGINASAIHTGELSAERVGVGNKSLGDVFTVELDEAGHPVVTIGSSDSEIKQKQTNDAVTFVDGSDSRFAKFTINGVEWSDMQQIKYCGFIWTKSAITGNVRFTKAWGDA